MILNLSNSEVGKGDLKLDFYCPDFNLCGEPISKKLRTYL